MNDRRALLRAILGSPRVGSALTTVAIGTAMLSFLLQRLFGLAGIIAIVVSLTLLLAGTIAARRGELEWSGPPPISLLLFAAWAALSVIWSQYQWATLGALAYFAAYTVIGLTIALTRDTIQVVRAFGDVLRVALILSLAVEVLAGVILDIPFVFLEVEGDLGRLEPIQGVFGSRNQLAVIALLGLVTFAIEFLTQSVRRTVAIGSLLGAAVCLALTQSPIVLLVLVVVAAASGALWLIRRTAPERRQVLQFTTVVVAAVAALVAWLLRARIVELVSANAELTYRSGLWSRIFTLIGVNPTFGWGWIGEWRADLPPYSFLSIAGQRDPTSAFNAYLDVWLQLGVVGVLLLVGMLALAFTRSWLLAGRKRNVVFAWPALVLLVLIVTSLVESTMLLEYGWLTFVICCAKAGQELSWRRALRAQKPRPAG